MNIFHRYVIREHIAPFVFSFCVIMFVLILRLLLDLMDMIISKGVNVFVMLQLIFYNLSWMIALVVPMSVLVATVMAYGRMGASGEITAMKAAGVSMFRLSSPVILLSILITILMVWFNNEILPDSNHRASSLKNAVIFKKPMLSLLNKEKQFITEIPNIIIRVDEINYETGVMNGITLFRRESSNEQTAIRAETGRFITNSDDGTLTLALKNGEIHRKDSSGSDRYVRARFQEFNTIFDFNTELDTSRQISKNDRTMTSSEMRIEINKSNELISHFQNRIDTMPPETRGGNQRKRNYEREITNNRKRIAKLLVEIHKKNSIPVAAIIFVLVGAPLGILVRRSGVSIGIGLSIGFFMLYYLFLIGGESAGDRMLMPAWLSMWAPNFVLGAFGIFLFIYATRR